MHDPRHKDESLIKEITKYAGLAINELSNRTSLITVTHAELSPNKKRVYLFLTILPEEQEGAALEFVKRHQDDIRAYIMKRVRLRAMPFLRFSIDAGEKNRQLITELLADESFDDTNDSQ